ncbi:MAG: FHA domain-containing protein [Candidatus Riflebacteria bacterium]|nr:FHA domain-containing protein [Candidatus Riflebacteria bacterium]
MHVSCPHCHRSFTAQNPVAGALQPCPHCLRNIQLPLEDIPSASLVVLEGEAKGSRIPMSARMILGRSNDCDVQVLDNNVSRQHAQITFGDGRFTIRDLGSRNGVVVNEVRVGERSLSHDDVIRLGPRSFRFEIGDASRTTGRMKLPASESVQEELHRFSGFSVGGEGAGESYRKAALCLEAIYEVSEDLVGVVDTDQILERILARLLSAVKADRAFAVLRYEASGEFTTTVVRLASQLDNKAPVDMSRSVLERVVSDKVSLLVADAKADSRFEQQNSIITQGIRSVMCAPLAVRSTVFGVLAVDTLFSRNAFDAEDLKMLTAIARQASVALQHARLIRQVEEETRTRGALERYLSPGLVEQVVKRTVDMGLGGHEQDLTVLFTDIRGFTRMAAELPPVRVVEIINEHFSQLVEIVFRHGGTLDKFIGDSVMAFWGAPVKHPDDPLRAVLCALEMQARVEELNSRAGADDRIVLPMGVGINTGRAVVGNIGSPQRYEYSALGDVVNVASHLQNLAERGQVLISGWTHEACRSRIAVRRLPDAQLKSGDRQVPVYLVKGPS